MLQKNLITKYDHFLLDSFTYKNIINSALMSDSVNSWYNAKMFQSISGISKYAVDKNNAKMIDIAKKIFFFVISKQKNDGYYLSDIYSEDHQAMRANVIFVNIELFNSFELLKKHFSKSEKEVFFASVNKSSDYIDKFIKSTKEVNQVIAALLYYHYCKKYDLNGQHNLELFSELVKHLQTDSGYWGEKKEALGFDALYGSLSLGYLAKSCDFDPSLKPVLKKGVEFISKFLKGGDLDLSFSKRWIPPTPQGHRFLVYALSKADLLNKKYLIKCLEKPNLRESYYVLKALESYKKVKQEKNKKSFVIDRIHSLSKNNLTLIFSGQPGRVSGGEPCSLYSNKKGWLIQQPIIQKNKLPSYCSQVRVHSKNKIYSSYLDHHTLLSNNSAITVLREENPNFAEFPYGYFQPEKVTSEIILKRYYQINNNSLEIKGKMFFDIPIDKIEVIIPLLNGNLSSEYSSKDKKMMSPYGELTVKILNIPFKKNKADFSIEIS